MGAGVGLSVAGLSEAASASLGTFRAQWEGSGDGLLAPCAVGVQHELSQCVRSQRLPFKLSHVGPRTLGAVN